MRDEKSGSQTMGKSDIFGRSMSEPDMLREMTPRMNA